MPEFSEMRGVGYGQLDAHLATTSYFKTRTPLKIDEITPVDHQLGGSGLLNPRERPGAWLQLRMRHASRFAVRAPILVRLMTFKSGCSKCAMRSIQGPNALLQALTEPTIVTGESP